MGRLSGRFALVDGFHRNRWTIWIGIGGRVQSESVDGLDRNAWTISGGILKPPAHRAAEALAGRASVCRIPVLAIVELGRRRRADI